jgi:hypothetical protein
LTTPATFKKIEELKTMKTKTILAALLLTCALTLPAAASPTVGQPAPAFTGTDAEGKSVSLADYKGKIVVLEWTSNECPFVHKYYDSGNMQKLQKAAAGAGVIWLSIDSSAPGHAGYMKGPEAAAWMKQEKASPSRVLIDGSGKIGHLYSAQTTPHMFVIGKDGTLAYAGAIDSIPSTNPADIAKADNYVQDAIDALQAGTPVKTASTKSYGCGVKY